MQTKRISDIVSHLQNGNIDIIAINPGPSMGYITGLQFHLMERPTLFLVDRSGKAALVLPELESSKVKQILPHLICFTYDDNPSNWLEAIGNGLKHFSYPNPVVGIEPNRIRYLELDFIQQAVKNVEFRSASPIIASIRIHKDQDEVEKIRIAVQIAEKAFLNTIPLIKQGMTETQIAAELTIQMLREGSDPEMPFSPIVASGPNSADPHAVPTSRIIQPGDVIVIDWGASYQGYFSDLTRVIAVGDISQELQNIHQVVLNANLAGRNTARPGLAAGEVDRAGRKVISSAGYAEYFTHRIGHGLGLEAHEDPYIYSDNEHILESGMVFTIEPGIYLPGKGGIRIEDDVVITDTGAESLSTMDRNLFSISGS